MLFFVVIEHNIERHPTGALLCCGIALICWAPVSHGELVVQDVGIELQKEKDEGL